MDKYKAHILVVDDDDGIRSLVKKYLNEHQFLVTTAESAEDASENIKIIKFDLIVLDIMMPGKNGLEFIQDNKKKLETPIILLTAKGEANERVEGLEIGADDYLAKPFSPKELEARIATILRRVGPAPTVDEPREVPSGQGVMKLGDLVVDTNRRQVSRGGERIGLTYTEFSLLELLFRDPGRVVPRAEILEQLWGYPPRRAADLRVVDVYVARLRGKLEPDPRNPELILTVRGIGYASQRMGEFPTAIAS